VPGPGTYENTSSVSKTDPIYSFRNKNYYVFDKKNPGPGYSVLKS
jgi:hypothetical protein